tara:strand:+ start:187 stop:534 length:348 start_codon:yes stop_codon:yes gene_type:complete
MKFKKKYSFEDRINESTRIIKKYPYRIPVICEPAYNCTFNLDKIKYLVPSEITLAQFLYTIRKRMKLDESKAIFIFINNQIMVPPSELFSEIYHKYKEKDNFLYMSFSGENTFGK